MSSFLGAKGTCSFNLDLIKNPSPSSGCSSTLTKSSSVSSLDIPTKRGRAPRKRPNQSYFEAATLLSTACPNVFSIKNLHKKHSGSFPSLSSSSLSSTGRPPSFPVLSDSDFLIEDPSPGPNLSRPFKFRPVNPIKTSCFVPRVGSPPGSPGYDVSSIFGDDDVEGIDSIMGKLSVNDCDTNCSPSVDPCINPFVGGKARLRAHNDDWWRLMPMVNMKDIVPKLNAMPSLERKKKTKKKKLEEVMDESEVTKTTTGSCITASAGKREGNLKSGLGLKLNHEEVIEAWGDREFPISYDPGSSEATSGIDLHKLG
ncbi:protein CHLOROPLAST IMPORT APPARATUS 2-like isoform X2 [Asparagus officinalis]|uniref:protein CHLOROPLAST IMPORT APPARATUS 2-like isoform X2 n=1 Tax=Asparagus officinalis TaxID=4686 RepID=UPI00098E4C05|nr:protein CHLOROPLAST IMPORT APPARATUS 2-like isoform X2 [Asparagus officinalis]